MLTKQTLIELADLVASLEPMRTSREHKQWEHTRDALANFCAGNNPRFMRSRWLGYIAGECGPNGGRRDHAD